MSHFIAREKEICQQPVLMVPNRRVIASKYKDALKNVQFPNKKQESLFLKNLYYELSLKEKEIIRKKNAAFMRKQYERMKKSMHNSASRNMSKSIIKQFFDGPENQKDINLCNNESLQKKVSETIDLSRKYQGQIERKMKIVKKVQEVTKRKELYRQWMNSTHNSPTKSPNYIRMKLMLQKLKEKQQLQLFSGQIRKSVESSHRSRPIIKKNQQYIPKYKLMKQKTINI